MIPRKIIFRPLARDRYKELYRGYKAIDQQLSERFRQVFHSKIKTLTLWPYLGGVAMRRVRYVNLRPFPYKVFYNVGRGVVRILTICHAKRHSRAWKRDLKSSD